MMTLDQFIGRLKELREMMGGDIPVGVAKDTEDEYEVAIVEVQNVLPDRYENDIGTTCWRSAPGQVNTSRIICVT